MPKLSIIIVSYNVKDFLSKCISSIQKENSDSEIIVVDNNSADGSCEMVKQNFPAVKLIENKDNEGFSSANNQGMAIAQGEFIFLLNPDTEIISGSIHKMTEYIQRAKENIILAPQLLNANGTPQTSTWWFPSAWEIFFEIIFAHRLLRISKYAPNTFEKTFEADSLSGAALMFSSSWKEKLLDENLFWMEDVDLCYRNKKSGGKNIYFPEAKIIHHIGQSSKKNFRLSISNQLISKLKFFKKHKKYFSFALSVIFTFIQIILRIVVFTLLFPFPIVFKKKLDAYLYSLIKFMKYIFLRNNNIG